VPFALCPFTEQHGEQSGSTFFIASHQILANIVKIAPARLRLLQAKQCSSASCHMPDAAVPQSSLWPFTGLALGGLSYSRVSRTETSTLDGVLPVLTSFSRIWKDISSPKEKEQRRGKQMHGFETNWMHSLRWELKKKVVAQGIIFIIFFLLI